MAISTSCCPNCSGALRGQKCKLLCPRCGYFDSCSDLEPAPLAAEGGPGDGSPQTPTPG